MGGWKLEVGKMAMYMSFPVALFHYFNQPQYYEKWVTDMKQELYPPDSKAKQKEFKDAIKKIQEKQEMKMLKAMEEKN